MMIREAHRVPRAQLFPYFNTIKLQILYRLIG